MTTEQSAEPVGIGALIGIPILEGYADVSFLNYDFVNCWTANNPGEHFSKQDVVAAIVHTGGNYAHMGRILKRSRGSVYSYIMANPDVSNIFNEIRESALDQIESGIIRSALDGNKEDSKFVMRTIGKDRGYTTRVEQTGKDGADLNAVRPNLSALPSDVIAALKGALLQQLEAPLEMKDITP